MSRIKMRKELTDKQIMNLLKKNRDILQKYRVKRIDLFGSYVRGEQKRRSDIDFLIEFDITSFDENFNGYFDNFMDLVSFLEDLLGRKVELGTNNSLSPYIRPYVEKEVKWCEK